MIALLRRALLGEPAAKAQDARAKEIKENEIKLRDWGFGPQRTAEKCRERLQRLCNFLLELDQESGAEDSKKSQIRKLKDAFDKEESREKSRDARIQRLEDLHTALSGLVREKDATEDTYFKNVEGWSPGAGLEPARLQALEKSLKNLRALAEGSPPGERPLDCLESLWRDLKSFEPQPKDDGVRARVRQCFEDCVGDWEWAHLQVRIRLARLLLEKEPGSKKAAEHLEEAIERLEDKELFQARFEGLYGRLAGNYLVRAQGKDLDPKTRLDLLYRALAYAQHAVELEPESARERLRLIEVFSALGDEEEMKIEAEIALNLEPSSSETLKTVGKSFWDQISSLHDRKRRRKVLEEAIQFFRNTLTLAESDRFNIENPREQMQTHGWAHFWLGRFQCESGRYGESVSHLRTARSLGFNPLESGVDLAWAYLLAKDYKQAGEAFSEADKEAKNPSRGSIPQGQGEERKIDDLKFQIHLGRAFLWAGRNPEGTRAEVREARKILKGENKDELEAALYEACGLAYLGEEKTQEALKELEAAVRLSPRSGAYCALASVRLDEARTSTEEKSKAVALRRAREAYRLARETDVRDRYRRELADLRLQLWKMEKPAPKPAQAAVSSTPPSAPSPEKT